MPHGWSNPDTCSLLPAHGTDVEEEEHTEFFSGAALAATMAPCLVAWAGVLDVHPCSGLLHFQPTFGPKGFERGKLKTKEMSLPIEGPSAQLQPKHCPFPLTFEYKSFLFFFFFCQID